MSLVLGGELLDDPLMILIDGPLLLLVFPLDLLEPPSHLLLLLRELLPHRLLSQVDLRLQLPVLPAELLNEGVQVGDPLVQTLEARTLVTGRHITKLLLQVSKLGGQVLSRQAMLVQLAPLVFQLGKECLLLSLVFDLLGLKVTCECGL